MKRLLRWFHPACPDKDGGRLYAAGLAFPDRMFDSYFYECDKCGKRWL